eukprot:CAMPEP_0176498442 /NCGR_PEP_ID=MMETSP0200_2-20121128/12321_1 /TAXON_ID=947934 /ORGANISM="Chaetoceros sp., Strain GSL56" /LENGTH=902 /DNA_ID=CAMNT_0017896645 /DNA_START=142 /DNA_END=2847 /DNA_ORIENTATION=+
MEPTIIQLDIDGKKDLGLIVCQSVTSGEGEGIHVAEILKGTQAYGKIFPLDEILYIDSVPLSGKSVQEFSNVIRERKAAGVNFKMTIARPPKSSSAEPPCDEKHASKEDKQKEGDRAVSTTELSVTVNKAKKDDVPHYTEKDDGSQDTKDKISYDYLIPKPGRGEQLGIDSFTITPGPLGLTVIEDFGIRVKQIKHDSQCVGKMQEGDWILEMNGTNVDNIPLADFFNLVKKMIGMTYSGKILKWNKITPAIRASHKVISNESTPLPAAEAAVGAEDNASNQRGKGGRVNRRQSTMEKIFKDWEALGGAPSENTRNKLAFQNRNEENTGNELSSQNRNHGDESDATDFVVNDCNNDGDDKNDKIAEAPSEDKPTENSEETKKPKNSTDTNRPKKSQRLPLHTSNELCDICGNPDSYLGCMILQKCCVCGVMVHEDCYGLHNEQTGERYPNWKCHACASVGKVVKLIKHDGEKKVIRIKTRAMHCCLCPISTGMHAMTPLYDTYGPKGQPIPAKAKNEVEGILWVHTLCALVIGSSVGTLGMVYGCYEDGLHIGGEEESDYDEEVESLDKICSFDLDYYKKDGEPLLLALLHHFVMENECAVQLKRMDEFRMLKCIFCKHADQKSRRIPMQCAYDDCELALHVGCGHWGKEKSRIEFFPGTIDKSGKTHDLVARGFCNKHFKIAKQISRDSLSENKKAMFYETARETEEMKGTSLKSGKDAEIFDDDSSFEDDNYVDDDDMHDVVELDKEDLIRPPTGTLKRKLIESSRIPHSHLSSPPKKTKPTKNRVGPNVSGKTSAYLEKKKRIQQYSLLMVKDLESRLKSGTSVRKAVKIVSSHWKNKLTESEFRMCREKNDDDMNALISQYKRIEESHMQQASRKALVERDRKNNRWKDLFMPSFKFG